MIRITLPNLIIPSLCQQQNPSRDILTYTHTLPPHFLFSCHFGHFIHTFYLLIHKHTHSVLMAIFPYEPALAGCPLILLLHLFINCASFWEKPKLSMSSLTLSHQDFFGHPLCLISSTSHVIQPLTQSLSSFCSTCPNKQTKKQNRM